MNVDPAVIHELRSMFREGATPSRLIRHIVARHPKPARRHALIQEYFLEAFGIPIVRGLDRNDDYRAHDLRYAFLNHRLVHTMLEHKSDWQRPGAPAARPQGWTDSVSATSDEQRFEAIRASIPPELADSWSRLSEQEQTFICRTMATAHGLSESVRILAALAERLQQRITELQTNGAARNSEIEADVA